MENFGENFGKNCTKKLQHFHGEDDSPWDGMGENFQTSTVLVQFVPRMSILFSGDSNLPNRTQALLE